MVPPSAARDRRSAGLRDGATSWGAVLALMAAGVVAAAQIGKASAALPVLQEEFGLGSTVGSWTGRPAALSCAAALVLVGGLLYRRLEKPLPTSAGRPALEPWGDLGPEEDR